MEIYRHAIHSRAFFTISRNSNEPRKLKSIMELEYRWQRADPLMPINSSIWFTSIKTDTFFSRLFIATLLCTSLYDERRMESRQHESELYFYLMRFFTTLMSFVVMGLYEKFSRCFSRSTWRPSFPFFTQHFSFNSAKKPDCCIFTKNPFHIWSDYVQFICVRIFSPFANLASGKVKAELFSFYKVKYLIKL